MTEIKNDTYVFSLRIPHQKSMEFLNSKQFHLERDILRIAQSVFVVERKLKEGKSIKKLVITLSSITYKNIDVEILREELEDLFVQVLYTKIIVIIKHKEFKEYDKKGKISFPSIDNICLFSGGVDSLSGILNAKKHYGNVEGVFIAHSDQAMVIKFTNHLINTTLKDQGIKCKTIYAPSIGREGYSQLRGFLYFVSAAIYLNLHQSNNLIVTECGPTMYQTRFAPSDSITMTTHPIVLYKVKKVIQLLLKREINIVLPFENLTKSEVMVNLPKKEYLKLTHSCISQAPFNHPYYHDGTCFGCVIKKIGSLCVGIPDEEYYKRDPFLDNDAKEDNLLSLMRFSYDVLTDYENMPFFSKEIIYLFDKIELFKRYALDTFTALYLLESQGHKLANKLKRLYNQGIKEIGEKRIENRIKEIRNNVNKPDFSKKV